MVTVPLQELRTVETKAAPTVFFNPRNATPEVFGAGDARGLSALANDLVQVGGEVGKIALTTIVEDNERETKKAETAGRVVLNRILNGDGTANNLGYRSQFGDDALANNQAIQDEITDEIEAIRSGLGNDRIVSDFDAVMAAPIEAARNGANTHAADQRIVANDAASTARQTQAVADAAGSIENIEESLQIVRGEVLDTADRKGWLPEKITFERTRAESIVLDAAIRGEMQRNLPGARELYNELKAQGKIDGLTRTKLDALFTSMNRTALGDADAAERRVDKRIKVVHDENESLLTDCLINGSCDATAIRKVQDNRGLSANGAIRLFKLATSSAATIDDNEAVIEVEDLNDEGLLDAATLTQMFRDGMLTRETFTKWRQRVRTQNPILDREDIKRIRAEGRRRVVTQTGAAAVLDRFEGERQEELTRQFNEMMEVNPEQDPRKLMDKLLSLDGFQPRKKRSGADVPLPFGFRPQFLVGTLGLPDILQTRIRTKKAWLENRIDDREYFDQLATIDELEEKRKRVLEAKE